MKKYFLSFLGVSFLLGVVACSNDPSVDNHPKEQVVPNDEQEREKTPDHIKQEDSGNKSYEGQIQNDEEAADRMEELNFTKFDLDVEYGTSQEVEYEYEQKSDTGEYKAEIQDTVRNIIYKGVEAFTIFYTQLKDLELHANMEKEATIQEMLNRFDLESDYNKFELQITFKDGSTLNIEDRK
ncbi:YusW family protein [Lederbergia sp. NSJ-179]|uniref:YusW family protein n=1 Tax=Lederbergia sp. NSJ-179 TaxID=2931402 RepID=UPI001FD56D82|nr:YusW family protein [Lederbergia sp. NSJ-179]MCJ7839796.1 YusW family protein [Lederbergia sp. NSJ-179]